MIDLAPKEWVTRQIAFEEILDELDREFASIKVPYMPIKGAYLIRSGLAPKLRTRRMDDIDILVQEKDFPRVCNHLVACGKATFLEDSWPFEKQLNWLAGGLSCLVEINYQLALRARYVLETGDLFNRSVAVSTWGRLPSRTDAMLITCCHALSHVAHELREDWFADMAVISDCNDFSWDTFWKRASATGILPFVGIMVELFIQHGGRCPANKGLTVYGRLLSSSGGVRLHSSVPAIVRRLMWELPFDKNPLGVILQKLKIKSEASLLRTGKSAGYLL
jgi:hypothetical protein